MAAIASAVKTRNAARGQFLVVAKERASANWTECKSVPVPAGLAACFGLVCEVAPVRDIINAYFMGKAESLVYLTPDARYHLYRGVGCRGPSSTGELNIPANGHFTPIHDLDHKSSFVLVSTQVRMMFDGEDAGPTEHSATNGNSDGYLTLDTGPVEINYDVRAPPDETVWVICDPTCREKTALTWIFLSRSPLDDEANVYGNYGRKLEAWRNGIIIPNPAHSAISVRATQVQGRPYFYSAILRRLTIRLHELRLRPHPFALSRQFSSTH